jgi:hypothetical protein
VRTGHLIESGAGGTIYLGVPIVDTSADVCAVNSASAHFTDRTGRQLGTGAVSVPRLDHRAILKPGAPGRIIIGVDNTGNFSDRRCLAQAAHALHVDVPGIAHVIIPTKVPICSVGYGRRPDLRMYGSHGTGYRENS